MLSPCELFPRSKELENSFGPSWMWYSSHFFLGSLL
ncbi:unnamed protein product [Ixodes pacificus]